MGPCFAWADNDKMQAANKPYALKIDIIIILTKNFFFQMVDFYYCRFIYNVVSYLQVLTVLIFLSKLRDSCCESQTVTFFQVKRAFETESRLC